MPVRTVLRRFLVGIVGFVAVILAVNGLIALIYAVIM